MSTFKSALLACTVGLVALSGCSHDDAAKRPMTEEQRIAALYALGDAPLKAAVRADESALRAMLESIGDNYVVSIGSITQDAKGDVAREVVIGLKEMEGVELNIAELRAWGANTDIDAALAAGNSARVADRVVAQGLSISGVETITQKMMDGYMEAVGDAAANLDSNAEAEFDAIEQSVSKYEIRVDRLVVDGPTLYPLSAEAEAYKLKTETVLDGDFEADSESFMAGLAMFARWSLGGGADAVSGSGMTGEFAFSQTVENEMIQDMDMTFSVDDWAYKDAHRGDVGMAVFDNMKMDINTDMSIDGAEMTEFMSQSHAYTRYILDGWRMSTLMEHLARGETPSMDVEDLMSFGRFRTFGQTASLNGKPYYSVEQSTLDMSDWRWFLPTKFIMSVKSGKLHTEAFTSFFGDLIAMEYASGEMSAEEQAEFDQIAGMVQKFGGVLAENGMSDLEMDARIAGNWDPDTGVFALDYDIVGVDLMREVLNVDMIFPTYADFKALAPAEGEELDAKALQSLFSDKTKFSGFTFSLDDDGLLEKVFNLVHGGAAIVPEEQVDDTVRMLQNTEPEQLRETTQGLIRMAGFAAKDEFPPAVSWVNAFADFVQQGGEFDIVIAPKNPMGAAEFEAEMQTLEEDPSYLVDLLGVSVTYIADESAETPQ